MSVLLNTQICVNMGEVLEALEEPLVALPVSAWTNEMHRRLGRGET